VAPPKGGTGAGSAEQARSDVVRGKRKIVKTLHP